MCVCMSEDDAPVSLTRDRYGRSIYRTPINLGTTCLPAATTPRNSPSSIQVPPRIDPELAVRVCASERQQIPLDLAEPDAVDRFRIPIALPFHANNQFTTANGQWICPMTRAIGPGPLLVRVRFLHFATSASLLATGQGFAPFCGLSPPLYRTSGRTYLLSWRRCRFPGCAKE